METSQYAKLWQHRLMLHDGIRNDVFQRAISQTVKPGQVVMDMGAGSGILSVFAARAGARKVYAIERTTIAVFAREVLFANGVEDRVEIIQSDIETALLPEKVDVIVSEWMGGFGVDENMLAPVLIARDRWLKPGGRMLPERVTAWAAPAWDPHYHRDANYWRSNPCDVDLSAVLNHTSHEILLGQYHITPDNLLAEAQPLWSTDVASAALEHSQRAFHSSLVFQSRVEGRMNGIAAWFDAEFGNGIELDTSPSSPNTHWGRTIFPLNGPVSVKPGMRIEVKITCEPSGQGTSEHQWAVRVADGEWQQHDTRYAIW